MLAAVEVDDEEGNHQSRAHNHADPCKNIDRMHRLLVYIIVDYLLFLYKYRSIDTVYSFICSEPFTLGTITFGAVHPYGISYFLVPFVKAFGQLGLQFSYFGFIDFDFHENVCEVYVIRDEVNRVSVLLIAQY